MPANHFVADLAALTAIAPSTVRINGYLKLVLNPGNSEPPTWYTYVAASTLATFGTIVLTPDDSPTAGRWYKQSSLTHYASANPATAPLLRGILWIASLSSPTRRVRYLSCGTAIAGDWVPHGNTPIVGSGAPAFTPDYVGQLYDDATGNTLYIAEGTTSSSDWSGR